MNITKDNYFQHIKRIGFEKLPLVLKQSHLVIMTKTDNGNDWKLYNSDKDLKRMIDLAFEKLKEYIQSDKSLSGVEPFISVQETKEAAVKVLRHFLNEHYPFQTLLKLNKEFRIGNLRGSLFDGHVRLDKIGKIHCTFIYHLREVKAMMEEMAEGNTKRKKKINFPHEHKFIKLILDLDGQEITKKELDKIIEDLQVDITQRKITKASPFKVYINLIQKKLVDVYNTMRTNTTEIKLKDSTRNELELMLVKTSEYLNNKPKPELPAKQNNISLKGVEAPVIPPAVESSQPEPAKLINSADFANMTFETIGFTGKWLAFIGNPSPGFKAAVSGMPKMGKTYLCIDFANYLSQNHGKVLYVSKEEFMSPTLQLKLKEKKVGNENLDVSGSIPADLSAYRFIFLDSVSSLKLSVDDLIKLEKSNPGKSFIYVFQVTKAGKARGTNEFMHNVDIIIEVPEKGKAVQYGRYNQGGEMDIFAEKESAFAGGDSLVAQDNASELSGIKKKETPKKKIPDWTEPKHLSSSDHLALKKIQKLHAEGAFKEAMSFASDLDTIVREEIPPRIWLDIGGTLTSTGWEKLRKSEKGSPENKNDLLEKIKVAVKKLEKVNSFIYNTKNAHWGEVASLALMHSVIGERLNDGYEGAHGYSKSFSEGLDRHYKANSKLLKEVITKMTEYAKKNYHAEMMDWYSFLNEEVERFSYYLNKIEEKSTSKKEGRKVYGKKSEVMKIETEFMVPIEVLASLLFVEPDEDDILDKMKNAPHEVEEAAKGLAEDEISAGRTEAEIADKKMPVKVTSVKFIENDDDDMAHGTSFFKVVLEGKEADLRQTAGPSSLFFYKW